ncbi:hypothetical protein [Labedaea rhizosphaerae]|uniref:Excreted virulence factor EspC (Type VII ESX diderm) n=1 Tax=Labedaea rhizosphaerae TaxID=598644 RepID=A0A4R6SA82_LABRH|nr:hypothetical protein [Labedaea rhizosphaerae]TDP96414.1 hypothetical protein EV186_104401 [Labedaea rhizosphaerae]
MGGYSISVEEVRATGQRLVADTAAVTGQVDAVLASQVVKDDFGAASANGVGARYLAVTHGALADSLRGFGDVSSRLAETLLATFEGYAQADEEARRGF